jgi:hypothetical protein
MRGLLILLIITLASAHQENQSFFDSDKYFALKRNEKMEKLWEKISENKSLGKWPSAFETVFLMTYSMKETFQHMGDEIFPGRQKKIHSVGTVSKCKFVAVENSRYTGMLKGASDMIVRYSVAAPIEYKKRESRGNFVPGISMKFLIDGKPSTNVMAMNSGMGSSNWNFFADNFTNNFDVPRDANHKVDAVGRKFSTFTKWIGALGLKELTSYDQFGKKEDKAVYPFRLVLKPDEKLQTKFPKEPTMDYIDQLKSLKSGTVLYHVYAQRYAECTDLELIGHLEMTSDMITSKFADEKLFFRHVMIDDDLDENKGWSDYLDEQYPIMGMYPAKKTPSANGCPMKDLFSFLY